MSGSNPPSTNGSPRLARRALLTGAAALTALALPVALVAATADVTAGEAATGSETPTSFLQGQLQLVQARTAAEATEFRASVPAPEPAPTTTTTAAPTTTTTAAPTTTTAPPPPPPPAPAPTTSASGDPNDPASWDRLAQCESGGNWAANTGNGYYGGIQFSLSSWQAVGGTGYPHEHSRETQIAMGQRLHAQGGWNHWPGCARSFGWI